MSFTVLSAVRAALPGFASLDLFVRVVASTNGAGSSRRPPMFWPALRGKPWRSIGQARRFHLTRMRYEIPDNGGVPADVRQVEPRPVRDVVTTTVTFRPTAPPEVPPQKVPCTGPQFASRAPAMLQCV
jgi:hypothetical protein